MSKTLFPACASFGPLFIAMGSLFPNRDGVPYGFIVAALGALATTAALLIIFRVLVVSEKTSSTVAQSLGSKAQESA